MARTTTNTLNAPRIADCSATKPDDDRDAVVRPDRVEPLPDLVDEVPLRPVLDGEALVAQPKQQRRGEQAAASREDEDRGHVGDGHEHGGDQRTCDHTERVECATGDVDRGQLLRRAAQRRHQRRVTGPVRRERDGRHDRQQVDDRRRPAPRSTPGPAASVAPPRTTLETISTRSRGTRSAYVAMTGASTAAGTSRSIPTRPAAKAPPSAYATSVRATVNDHSAVYAAPKESRARTSAPLCRRRAFTGPIVTYPDVEREPLLARLRPFARPRQARRAPSPARIAATTPRHRLVSA